MKILTAAQMQLIDRQTSERYGVPSLTLMENAGRAFAEFLFERFAPLEDHRIAILCGKGNNGGDGLVVARLLRQRGLTLRVLLFAEPKELQGDAATNYDRLRRTVGPEVVAGPEAWRRLRPQLAERTLFVDALLGTGLTKPLEGFLLEVVRDLNSAFPDAQVVSVDLPTGLSADSGELIGEYVLADATVTFTAPKWAHVFPPACEYVGEWLVREIGTPLEALENNPEFFLELTPPQELDWLVEPRKLDAHKGNFGHVLILAGSVGKTGAAALAAKAALRAGAGLVTVATPRGALPVVASLGLEYMTEPLPETDAGTVSLRALDYGRLDKLVEGKTVLAVGPGIGTVAETAELVRTVTNRYDLPIVLDADGLTAWAGCLESFKPQGRLRVLTPHPGEMARLTGETTKEIVARRIEVARGFARAFQALLVLKGFRTLTAAPDGRVWVNPTGNSGMATGGTGDVLTGLISGLLAQHASRPPASVVSAAVYLHGLAGDLAAAEKGQSSMIAGDLLEAIPRAFRSLKETRQP